MVALSWLRRTVDVSYVVRLVRHNKRLIHNKASIVDT